VRGRGIVCSYMLKECVGAPGEPAKGEVSNAAGDAIEVEADLALARVGYGLVMYVEKERNV
jgi:hypothetical protein